MEVYAVFQKDNEQAKEKTLCILFSEEYLANDYIKRNQKIRKNNAYFFYERWRVHYKEVF